MFAVIDIETTGGSLAQGSRITEIGCVIFDGEKIVEVFSTLVNPECNIPPFITRLTGISNQMVENAPRFFEVAEKLVKLTEGKIFVGHNVQFDYGHIKHEYKMLGYRYERDTFCTCRISRKLLPGYSSYSLGNLTKLLSIPLQNHHRAQDDAVATTEILRRLILEHGIKVVTSLKKAGKEPDLNELLESNTLKDLPEKTGVYFFYDHEGNVIYVGKANNIRKRVVSHFRNKSASKTLHMRSLLADIDYELTGNELMALLIESAEIKKHQPRFNRSQRRMEYKFGVYDELTKDGYIELVIDNIRENTRPLAWFGSAKDAKTYLEKITERFNLCKRFTALQQINGACFRHQLKMCNGACVGTETPYDYNQRVQEFMSTLEIALPDVLLIDKGREEDEKSAILIEDGIYKARGFFNPAYITHPHDIKNHLQKVDFHPDFHHILRSAINRKKYFKLIELNKVQELL
ncbi:MAG TPA: exonuclease domain-containing protein [Bacteroidia bacterium]|nr:exonuclease domain-containing protein [Bacteroidia bacterium]HNU34521.1 exonuclease domain-containing protein [Bacteroidia bacterium]